MRPFSVVCCVAVLALASAAARGQAPVDRAGTLKFLKSLEVRDGGYAPGPPAAGATAEPSLSATTSALRATKYFGGTVQNSEAHARFVTRCYDAKAGSFSDRPGGTPTVNTTVVGVLAAAELGIPPDRFREGAFRYLGEHAKTFEDLRIAAAAVEALQTRPPQADQWLREVAKLRKADGTYGQGDGAARLTGSAVPLVLRLGGQVEDRDAVLRVLKAGQRSDGGFGQGDKAGSDLGTTYRVMRAFKMLNARPDDPVKLRAYVATCRNQDGGYGVATGQLSTASGTYFAGIVLHWLDAR
jgi:prenyltransferase beta subunit